MVRLPPLHLCLPALIAVLNLAATAEPLTTSERQEFNYAFASQVGSGIFTISGRTLQVYRLPLSVTFHSTEDRHAGWRLTFPMTFGFYDFQAQDVPESGLPANVATLSLVPGVEFLVLLREHWLLKPYAEAGYVWDRSGDADAAVYSAGIRSRFDFQACGLDMVLGNGLNYALVDPTSEEGRDAMVMAETASSASHLFGSGGRGQADYAPYFVWRVYFGGVDHPLQGDSSTLGQYEAGITFGSRDPAMLWKIPLPRLGVGYLFGHDLAAVRIVFGIPAPSLKR
jgi:hypothetical protein